MATVKSASQIDATFTLVLTESEARAMAEMTGYGAEPFIKGYYKHLGEHYMKPHEAGIRSLFSTINTNLPKHIKRVDATRKAFREYSD